MCGIVGFRDADFRLSKEVISTMAEAISHRGPNAQGSKVMDCAGFRLGFGFKRLSILDLSTSGNQPMAFEHLLVVFNGEVYNYKKIRKELQIDGYTFNSTSDTEVILKAFHRWGDVAVHKFNGMFAIALFDDYQQSLTLYRDRLGIKPLYYLSQDNLFAFASEVLPLLQLPGLQKKVERKELYHYLFYGYAKGTSTCVKGISKVAPGQTIELNKAGKIAVRKYYQVSLRDSPKKDMATNINLLQHHIRKSVQSRLVADVPIGSFLSGGYDSSLISAVMQEVVGRKIDTFSIGFEEKQYDESPYARQVAKHLQTNHHELVVSIEKLKGRVEDLINKLDEPLGDSSFLPTYLVSEMASSEVKVILSGDGGDELFMGYNTYRYAEMLWTKRYLFAPFALLQSFLNVSRLLGAVNPKYAKYPFLYRRKELIQHNYLTSKNILHGLIIGQDFIPDSSLVHGDHIVDTYSFHDLKSYLPNDILTKVDRASMLNSLEARTPFLDHELIAFALGLPTEQKFGSTGKWILKELTHQYIPKILMDRPKKGFAIPLGLWLRSDFRHLLEENLSERLISEQGIFDYKKIKYLLKLFYRNKINFIDSVIWNLIVFQLWWKRSIR